MRRLIAVLAVSCTLAVPAQALAVTTAQVTAAVKAGYTKQLRAKAGISGFRLIAVTMKCASTGTQRWSCYSTYTLKNSGTYFKYGIFIDVTPKGWQTQTNKATLLKTW
jgi:hypothetical protein